MPRRWVNVDALVDRSTATGRDIVVGDFNLDHPAWSGDLLKETNRCKDAVSPQRGMMEKAGMRLWMKPGTVTFSRGTVSDDKSNASCINLTFVGPDLFHQVDLERCGVFDDNPWDPSDHRPIRTTLDITPMRDDTKRFMWKDCNDKAFREGLESRIKSLHDTKLNSKPELDLVLDNIHAHLDEALRIAVPSRLANSIPRQSGPLQMAAIAVRLQALLFSGHRG